MPKQHPGPFSAFLRTVHSALRMAASQSISHGDALPVVDESRLGNSAIVTHPWVTGDLTVRLVAVVWRRVSSFAY